MICVDNSEWMRNGDYSPSRFLAQADAVNLICGAKTQVLFRFCISMCVDCVGSLFRSVELLSICCVVSIII